MFSTRRVRTILLFGIALLFFSTLFPPWVVFTVGKAGSTELPLGFGFLFTTPEPQSPDVHIKIDFVRLAGEWIVLLCWVLLALLRQRKHPDSDAD